MPLRRTALLAAATLPAAACAPLTPAPAASPASRAAALAQLRAAETAFAETMARRDHAAFGSHLHPEAVFINGGQPLRGRAAIVQFWERFFTGPSAPFSWEPSIVEVASGGTLGYTEGPVTLASGASTSRFYTTWQRQAHDGWLVIFDNGYRVCQ